jgi:type IV pilus biogenesis protein CpaD/CtpE
MKIAKTLLLAALLALGAACGYSSKATTPATAGAMPTIDALLPDNANAGSTSVVLTVNGSSFNGNATINWNGAALTTSHVSANQLTATVPDSDVATSGTATVTVTNPGTAGGIYGGGTMAETSNSMNFAIN